MGNSELKVVPIRDHGLQCMFQVRNFNEPGVAASDCCGRGATSSVERSDGMRTWRCDEHRGMVDANTKGPVHETMTTRDDVHPSLVLAWPERASTGQ